MRKKLLSRAAVYLARKRQYRLWLEIVGILACMVVLGTTYALILPAITLGKNNETSQGQPKLICSSESLGVHQHTKACYDENNSLVCQYADFIVHKHDEQCYDQEGSLICTFPEIEAHSHTADCYMSMVNEGHAHTEDCYGLVQGGLICGQEASETHQHMDECYSWENMPVCGKEEQPESSVLELICGKNEVILHSHSGACYDEYSQLICGQTEIREHVHEATCFEEAGENTVEFEEAETEWRDGTLTCEGEDYTVTVVYGADAHIPEDAELRVIEYAKTSETYRQRYDEAKALYGWEEDKSDRVWLFDVGFYVGEDEIEPAAAVNVTMTCDDWTDQSQYIITHFVDEGESEKVEVQSSDEGNDEKQAVSFVIDSFSQIQILADIEPTAENIAGQYAIVNINIAGDNVSRGDKGAMLAEYLDDSETIIKGENIGARYYEQEYTVMLTSTEEELVGFQTKYQVWWFEPIDEAPENPYESEENQYYIYAQDTAGGKKYLTINNDSLKLESEPAENSKITVTVGSGDYEGMVRLTNADGMAVNLYGGQISNGFGHYNDSLRNEWLVLCQMKLIDVDSIGTTEGISPTGAVINLFDYWTTQRYPEGGDYEETGILDSGINENHVFKFYSKDEVGDGINKWTGTSAVYPNIVQNSLVNGYPALNLSVTGSEESLAYLFDPEVENPYRQTFRRVRGLLQTSDDGYYYYNSQENFAELDEDTNNITLYDQWGVVAGGFSSNGQFFPFNSFRENVLSSSKAASMNHYFGMTLTARFVQRYDGYTDSSRKKATTFEFSGDDDVWIFVDDVLVADLGGIHDAASVKIDFAAGTVTINNGTPYTIYSAYEAAGKTGNTRWMTNKNGTQIFENETYHTLKFYYLERGNVDSNLKLMYNLTEIPVTSINKVDQYGEKVPGARFAVYAADAAYNYLSDLGGQAVTLPNEYYFDENGDIINSSTREVIVKAQYIGTTDSSGQMIFKDEDEMPYALNDLQRMFGDNFVLREVYVPDGYRLVKDEIYLKNTGKMLICENSYESGVNASSNLMVVATDTLHLARGGEQVFYTPGDSTSTDGTLFAVVMKYTGDGVEGLAKQTNWVPVYGNDIDGYNVVPLKEYGGDLIQGAIIAAKGAKALNQDVEFSMVGNGTMQLDLKNLPGSIANYYYMLDDAHKDQTEYTIAYYWTSAASLEGATADNTFRVLADKNEEIAYNGFDRAFGSTISVPNVNNRFFVQKFDEDGETLLNGAVFAMYRMGSDRSQLYYIADDETEIILGENRGDNTGTAQRRLSNETYEYRVDPLSGVITVGSLEDDGSFAVMYTISPAKNAKGESLIATTVSSSENGVGEDGTLSFASLDDGDYILREVSAPDGYTINATETMILVSGDAIYANAGKADDGVTVGMGPGYVLATMRQFASDGDIDKSLTWIYTMLRVSKNSNLPFGDHKTWEYATGLTTSSTDAEDALRTYFKYDAASGDEKDAIFNYILNEEREGTGTRRLYTDVGWSYLEVYQDSYYRTTAEAAGANYENLEGQDISKIFSRSVYVRVTDQKVGELRISKTVENNTEDMTEFQFKVTLSDKDGTALTGNYPYRIETVTASENEEAMTVEEGEITGGSGTLTLKHGQTAVIQNLPAGTRYTVTEERAEGYSTKAVRDKGKDKIGETNEYAGEKNYVFDAVAGDTYTVNGQLYWKIGENGQVDKTSTVDYVNSPSPNITVLKYQSGTSGEDRIALAGAQFVLYHTVAGENNIETKYYYDGTGGWTTKETFLTTSSEEGKKGKIFLLHLPDGEYILMETKAPDGYNCMTEEIRITISGGKIQLAKPVGEVEFSEDQLTLYVPNSTGYVLPETGGWGTYLYTFGGLLLMAGALMCGYILRYRRERRLRKNGL